MSDYITCEEMKALEKKADAAGLSYYQMMENAGTSAFNLMRSRYCLPAQKAQILIFCGKGNNGGDGFVVARKFAETGACVTVMLVDGVPVTKDAVTNFQLICEKLQVIDMTQTETPFAGLSEKPDLIVDAIYGTGFHGRLRPGALKAVNFINGYQKTDTCICALDIPSGLNGNADEEAQIDPQAVRADCTITFHMKKPVHLQAFAEKYCGETILGDIGIRDNLFL